MGKIQTLKHERLGEPGGQRPRLGSVDAGSGRAYRLQRAISATPLPGIDLLHRHNPEQHDIIHVRHDVIHGDIL